MRLVFCSFNAAEVGHIRIYETVTVEAYDQGNLRHRKLVKPMRCF